MGTHYPEQICYSEKYMDDHYEYRHVTLSEKSFKKKPHNGLLSEMEARELGVQMTPGWEHYLIFPPEPHVLLFRRPLNKHHYYPENPLTNFSDI